MKKRIMVIFVAFLLVSIPMVSAVEFTSVQHEIQSKIKEKLDWKYEGLLNGTLFDRERNHVQLKNIIESWAELKDTACQNHLQNIFSNLANGNNTLLFIIGALVCSLIFFVTTQPIFLQLIVEAGTETLFVGLLIFLIILELVQKFFTLKALGLWETYIVEEVDGVWNFFSLVFFSVYVKIYLSYLPAFIIQYSQVVVKAFFYMLMFAIPILFNFCIADSLDLIDWNGDEQVPTYG